MCTSMVIKVGFPIMPMVISYIFKVFKFRIELTLNIFFYLETIVG